MGPGRPPAPGAPLPARGRHTAAVTGAPEPGSGPDPDPRDPRTLGAAGPVADEPPDDDLPEASPLRDSGGTGPGPDDLD